jgi:biotin carboxyl carrier protein
MKMEHVIRAPQNAVVKQILYKEGDLVGEKKQLVVLE